MVLFGSPHAPHMYSFMGGARLHRLSPSFAHPHLYFFPSFNLPPPRVRSLNNTLTGLSITASGTKLLFLYLETHHPHVYFYPYAPPPFWSPLFSFFSCGGRNRLSSRHAHLVPFASPSFKVSSSPWQHRLWSSCDRKKKKKTLHIDRQESQDSDPFVSLVELGSLVNFSPGADLFSFYFHLQPVKKDYYFFTFLSPLLNASISNANPPSPKFLLQPTFTLTINRPSSNLPWHGLRPTLRIRCFNCLFLFPFPFSFSHPFIYDIFYGQRIKRRSSAFAIDFHHTRSGLCFGAYTWCF